jgi:glycosyltransferase involved in cell wall biosynthesis
MFSSPFDSGPKISIPEETDVVFVADLFLEDYVGGAELTTEALITSCPLKIFKIRSQDVNLELLEQGHRKFWIFGNFAGLDLNLIPTIVANMKYSILEYDYKFCRYRSPEKHELAEKTPCDCNNQEQGKMVSAFMLGAKSVWWMSEKQQEKYLSLFPFLAERENTVLSSVFDDAFFLTVKLLRDKYSDSERKGWLVLGSTSWIKGTEEAQQWCKENEKDYTLITGWPYEKVLEEMAQAEGFVYLPPGADTCPRMVIEAKLLGCKLHLNENVQHKNEIWFDTDDMFDTEAYLYAARERFWTAIQSSMNYIPNISGYTTTLDCIKNGYPWKESIKSLLGFCTEVIVVDGGSTDGTWDELECWANNEDRLSAFKVERDWNDTRFAVFDGAQKAAARELCTGDYCWQQDADEIVHEEDYQKIIQFTRNFPAATELVCLPVVEYWGKNSKVRMDVNPWKWRLSKNLDHITHGIPKALRRQDENGKLYASPGTDGCDYVHKETGMPIPFASFYSQDIHNVKIAALQGNKEARNQYEMWFNRLTEMLPGVYHYSWYDLDRKIKTYKNYWSQHWQSLYNIDQEDTSENNMFFDKPWSEVSDEEIKEMATKLEEKLGGWIFHSKVDFNNPTPHISIEKPGPELMKNYDDES